jgi:hypothetical protein
MVEGSTFRSEFVHCESDGIWLIVALQYKLRMFDVPIDGSTNVFCDNCSVVMNVSILELILMKRHNAIYYHFVQEAVAAKIIWVGKKDEEMKNSADLFTSH